MEKWQWVSLILCAFGLFKEFRPSEPFVTDYLIDFKNFTSYEVIHVAYPIATYTYLGTLPIVFLITDFLRYKRVLLFEGLAFIVTYILLIWGNSMSTLIAVEILYGIASSTEVAYYTYIYAKVDRDKYQKVTSYTYTATLIGNFVAAVVSQLLVSTKLMDFRQLNFLTLASVSVCFLIACFLPRVTESMYFFRSNPTTVTGEPLTQNLPSNNTPVTIDNDDDNGIKSATTEDGKSNTNSGKSLTFLQRVRTAYPFMWKDFKSAYANPYVLKWSIWWAIASAGFLQVINYIQALWIVINRESGRETSNIYNGAVDATHTILSASLALGVGYVKIPWYKWGESLLTLISFLQGALLILMSQMNSIWIAYVGYIVFRTLYQVMITVATAEVAQGISDDSYGLIFGINRFLALSIQTILTVVVSDDNGLALNEKTQFVVYGSYFLALGLLFFFVSIYTFSRFGCSDDNPRRRQQEKRMHAGEHSEVQSIASGN